MRLARVVCWMAVVGLSVLPGSGWAQFGRAEEVRRAIEETDRRIEQAEAAVSVSGAAQARSELRAAQDLQARAKLASGQGRYSIAGELTMMARGRADRAILLARNLPDPDRVMGQLERTRETLDLAGERLRDCRQDRARSMLRVAREMQDRAESGARASRYLGALQLTMAARERGLRALRLCRMEENLPEVAERALRRTDEILSRARALLDAEPAGGAASQAVRDALGRASGLQEDAHRKFRDERYEASLQLTLSARRVAHRALRHGSRAL